MSFTYCLCLLLIAYLDVNMIDLLYIYILPYPCNLTLVTYIRLFTLLFFIFFLLYILLL